MYERSVQRLLVCTCASHTRYNTPNNPLWLHQHPASRAFAPAQHNSCSNTGRTNMVDGFAHSVLLSVVPVILVEKAPTELLCLHKD